MKTLSFPLYPFLIVILFPLNFFVQNTNFFDFSNVLIHIAILLAIAGVLFGLLWTVTRSRDIAALIVTVLVIMLNVGPNSDFIWIAVLGIGLIGFAAHRLGGLRGATVIANVFFGAVLIQPAFQISLSATPIGTAVELSFGPFAPDAGWQAGPNAELPSMVHIVPDGYSGRSMLQTLFDHDNSGFSDALAERGFLVFEDVATPYNQTLLSMAAVMNGDAPPLDDPALEGLSDNLLRISLGSSVVDGAAVRRFREAGHQLAFTLTGYNAFRYPEDSVVFAAPRKWQPSLFDLYYGLRRLDRWGLSPFDNQLRTEPLRREMENALAPELATRLREPFFLYSHILTPHPPFYEDRDGNPVDDRTLGLLSDGDHALGDDESLQPVYRFGYREKLINTNRALLAQVDGFLDAVEGPLVIVIHGDHGSGTRLKHESADATCLAERMQTTFAIYTNVPEIRAEFERAGFTNTINLYRRLFGAIDGRPLADLDTQYFSPWSTPRVAIPLAGKDFLRNCH